MSEPEQRLEDWMARVEATNSAAELSAVLEAFRKHPWTEEQRAKLWQVYMRSLAAFARATAASSRSKAEDKGPEGPTWYEKM